jgi:hypothetical protein
VLLVSGDRSAKSLCEKIKTRCKFKKKKKKKKRPAGAIPFDTGCTCANESKYQAQNAPCLCSDKGQLAQVSTVLIFGGLQVAQQTEMKSG